MDHPQVPSAVAHHHNRSTGPGRLYLKQTSHNCGSRYTNSATDILTVAPTIRGLTKHCILRCKVHMQKCKKWNSNSNKHYVTPNFKEHVIVNTQNSKQDLQIYHIYANARRQFSLKFDIYVCEVVLNSRIKHRTRPPQTRSLWTGPCGAKPRTALPSHARSGLFWDITQHRVVTLYRRFGTTYGSHLQENTKTDHIMTEVNWQFSFLWLCPLSEF